MSDQGNHLATAQSDYRDLVDAQLSLDLTRGKPSPAQLDLAAGLLTLPGEVHTAGDGSDVRNYGGLNGLTELREIFSPVLDVPVNNIVVGGNSSLEVMHDTLVTCMLSPMPGGEPRWVDVDDVTFICPVPGYDRHFGLCERFGITMVTVPMTPEGPDIDAVRELAASDPKVKGIWCVPKYSNPDGVTYSDDIVKALAEMPTAASDFRIFWDNAYAVHHLTDEHDEVASLFDACIQADNPDRAFIFASTSKVTLAGSGVSFFGASDANLTWWLGAAGKRTIGPDKVNQLRHVLFLGDTPGLHEHMARHAEIIAPKFHAADEELHKQLDGTDLASWNTPSGGYFITVQVKPGTARRVVQLAKDAGIALTPAGSTHPYLDDPTDSFIRLAPTFPDVDSVREAIKGVAVCIRLAGYEPKTE